VCVLSSFSSNKEKKERIKDKGKRKGKVWGDWVGVLFPKSNTANTTS
jgi:hypothetical protein